MKKLIVVFVLVFFCSNFNSQISNAHFQPSLYGNWEFQYLLVNNNQITWHLQADTTIVNYFNIYFFEKDTFSSMSIKELKNTKFKAHRKYFIVKEMEPEPVYPFASMPDSDSLTLFKIKWLTDFFQGKCKYFFENDSILKVHKTNVFPKQVQISFREDL